MLCYSLLAIYVFVESNSEALWNTQRVLLYMCILPSVEALAPDEANINIACNSIGVEGDVEAITWSHEPVDGVPVNLTMEYIDATTRVSTSGNMLVFTAVEISDDGLYVCYFSTDANPGIYNRRESGCIAIVGK